VLIGWDTRGKKPNDAVERFSVAMARHYLYEAAQVFCRHHRNRMSAKRDAEPNVGLTQLVALGREPEINHYSRSRVRGLTIDDTEADNPITR